MRTAPIYIQSVGMACPVGLTALEACAAMRAGIDLRGELSYVDNHGHPIVGSSLSLLHEKLTERHRWTYLLAYALRDVLQGYSTELIQNLPIILTVPSDLNENPPSVFLLANDLSTLLDTTINAEYITLLTHKVYGGYNALAIARQWFQKGQATQCLVCAADSLISARRLLSLIDQERLLIAGDNPDGLTPGEAAVCLLVGSKVQHTMGVVRGIGIAQETALLSKDEPLRSNGIVEAATMALKEAGLAIHDMDFRLSDATGESYHFKEQALFISRLLRSKKENFPLWLPALTLGHTGAATGLCNVAQALASFQHGYAPGHRALAFAGSDNGERGVLVLEAWDK